MTFHPHGNPNFCERETSNQVCPALMALNYAGWQALRLLTANHVASESKCFTFHSPS